MDSVIPKAFDDSMVESLDKSRHEARNVARSLVLHDTWTLMKTIRVIPIKKESNDMYVSGISAGGYLRNPKTNKIVDYQWRVEGDSINNIPGLTDDPWKAEYGSAKYTPKPYMRPGIERALRKLGGFFRNALHRRVEKG